MRICPPTPAVPLAQRRYDEADSCLPTQPTWSTFRIIGTKSVLFPRPLNESQSRAQLSLWAALKSPLLISADLTNVSQDLIAVLQNSEVLDISDDKLGREAVRLEDQLHSTSVGEIYAGPTTKGFVAVMFNRETTPQSMALHLTDIIPQSNDSPTWAVRDLWAHASRGTLAADGVFSATVPGNDVVMITLVPSAEQPFTVRSLHPFGSYP